jgi:hypothetical protein
MKSTLRKCLLLAPLAALALAEARAAATINWGSPITSVFRDSQGNILDPSIYRFELGAFTASFTPSSSNISLWRDNWRVFDVADYRVYDFVDPDLVLLDHTLEGELAKADFGSFSGAAELLADGTSGSLKSGVSTGFDFSGLNAYIWGYNTATYDSNLEWVIVRDETWTFPVNENMDPDNCCPLTLAIDWSLSDLTYTTDEAQIQNNDTALYGSQGGSLANGLGEFTTQSESFTLQTFTIPEPSSALVCLLLAAGLLRRQKTA